MGLYVIKKKLHSEILERCATSGNSFKLHVEAESGVGG